MVEQFAVSAVVMMVAVWITWASIKLSVLQGRVERLERESLLRQERELDQGPRSTDRHSFRSMWDEE